MFVRSMARQWLKAMADSSVNESIKLEWKVFLRSLIEWNSCPSNSHLLLSQPDPALGAQRGVAGQHVRYADRGVHYIHILHDYLQGYCRVPLGFL